MVNKRISDKKPAKGLSLEEKILTYLIENIDKRVSILKISKDLGIDYKNVFQAVERLVPILIVKEKLGNTSIVRFNFNFNSKVYSAENSRRKRFLEKNKQMNLIMKDAESLGYPFYIVLVFGSAIKGKHTKSSDIDLCVISDVRKKTKNLISKLRLLPLPLEIHDFTSDEFESMLNKKEGSVADEIAKSNIILYGIENYYALVSKWMKKELK